jgi:hypothetical protein
VRCMRRQSQCGTRPEWTGCADSGLARLQGVLPESRPHVRPESVAAQRRRVRTVKKVLLLVVAGLGVLAVWRKVQADRAELDLWTEATTEDE